MAKRFADTAAIGAGTVLEPNQVDEISNAGGTFVVSPNVNVDVIGATIAAGMTPIPGFVTPTEAFTALRAGARYLKLFPADASGPTYLKALNAVLPEHASVIAVGGIGSDDIPDWMAAGVAGFGIGSPLFRPGMGLETIRSNATTMVECLKSGGR
jgi:2-dehydro-3-deoxyphosphogalactonate aldolase